MSDTAGRADHARFSRFMAVNACCLVGFMLAPHASDLPAGLVAIAVYIICPLIWPLCYPDFEQLLCPRNLGVFLFWMQLVVLPVLIGYCGFSRGTLPYLPALETINAALLLHAAAYAAFAFALHRGLLRSRGAAAQARAACPWDPAHTPAFLAFCAVVGVAGFLLAFPTPDEYVAFLSDPTIQQMREQELTTFPRAAASFLRPFLSFAVVLAWSHWLNRVDGRRPLGLSTVFFIAMAVCIPFLNFNYNRGSMLGPVLAIGAAYSVHVRRLSLPVAGAAGLMILLVAFAFGAYRQGKLSANELVKSGSPLSSADGSAQGVDFLQVYGNAPQFSAFLMEQVHTGTDLYWGRTLVSSALYPLPVLGKPFRASSGVEIYNRLIYGASAVVDQVILYEAEFYINFHIIGVIVGYALLGLVVSFFQGRFDSAASPVETYAWFWMALWTVWPGSVAVTSQAFIYAFWPIYLYLTLSWASRHGLWSQRGAIFRSEGAHRAPIARETRPC